MQVVVADGWYSNDDVMQQLIVDDEYLKSEILFKGISLHRSVGAVDASVWICICFTKTILIDKLEILSNAKFIELYVSTTHTADADFNYATTIKCEHDNNITSNDISLNPLHIFKGAVNTAIKLKSLKFKFISLKGSKDELNMFLNEFSTILDIKLAPVMQKINSLEQTVRDIQLQLQREVKKETSEVNMDDINTTTTTTTATAVTSIPSVANSHMNELQESHIL
eukprot:gene9318-19345_t